MNILYLCDEYPPGRNGGIGTTVQLLGREMVKQGHNVVVAGFYDWGYGGQDYFEDEGVKVYRFRRIFSSSLLCKQDTLPVRIFYRLFKDLGLFEYDIKKSIIKYGVFLEKLIVDYKINVVEMPDYNDYMRFCKGYIAFPKLPVPVIVKMHGGMTYVAKGNNKDVPHKIWQMEHDLLLQATAVSSVSKYNAQKTSEYLEYPYPIKILYNGISTNVQPGNIVKKKNKVIYTGSLDRNKGVYQLMVAWNKVNEELPSAELYLYGKGPIEKIAHLLSGKAIGSVFFKGHIPRQQLFNELASANVAVFPSFVESFALAPMEAMLCNTAVIYTALTSGPELIDNGKNGLLADPANIDDIANKILLLLNNDQLNATLANNGRVHIKANFDIEMVAKKNIEYYSSIQSPATH